MKYLTRLSLFCGVLAIAGCSEPANKTVTGDADLEGIKAYEAAMANLESSQSSMEEDGGEDAEAVDPIKPKADADAK
ncbi:MAG: hypothetical protein WBD31_04815 [Rubripirellula sp.]